MPWATGPKIKLAGQPDPDALKLAAEIRKKQVENERFFADRAVAAGAAGKTGFAKEAEEMTAEIAKRTSFVDDRGKMHQVRTDASGAELHHGGGAQEVRRLQRARRGVEPEGDAEAEKEEEELARKRLEWDGKLFEQRMKHNQEAVREGLRTPGAGLRV